MFHLHFFAGSGPTLTDLVPLNICSCRRKNSELCHCSVIDCNRLRGNRHRRASNFPAGNARNHTPPALPWAAKSMAFVVPEIQWIARITQSIQRTVLSRRKYGGAAADATRPDIAFPHRSLSWLSFDPASTNFFVSKTSPRICVHSETILPTTWPHLDSEFE